MQNPRHPMPFQPFQRPLALLIAAAAFGLWLSAALPLSAQNQPPASGEPSAQELLAPQRWQEGAYGLSLRPPLGAQIAQQAADEALVRFTWQDRASIELLIRHSKIEVDLETVQKEALNQFAFAYPSAVVLEDVTLALANRPAVKLYYRVPDPKRGDWVLGQGLILIDPVTLAVLQFRTSADHFEQDRPYFEAVLQSVELADPQELDRQRHMRIAQGELWRKDLTPQKLRQALGEPQWFRVLKDGRDVGFIRMRQQSEKVLAEPGISIEVQSRVQATAEEVIDSLGEYFASDDGKTELWSIRTTRRPARSQPLNQSQDPQELTWVETGVRSGATITVHRQSPTDIKDLSWQMPTQGYLSQVELLLLPALLPHDQATEMAFYAYYADEGRLTLRTFRVQPLGDGRYQVHDRPAPDRMEETSVYDAQGRLIQRQTVNGLLIVPAQPEQIQQIWRARG